MIRKMSLLCEVDRLSRGFYSTDIAVLELSLTIPTLHNDQLRIKFTVCKLGENIR